MSSDQMTVVDGADAQREAFLADVIQGLSQNPKRLPSRWLYDDAGSELFEEITALEEYYPTRTETAILRDDIEDIASFCGAGAVLVEYGAGAGVKTEIVLAGLEAPRAYVPVDIAGDFLELSAARLRKRFDKLDIRPVVADFTAEFDLPDSLPEGRRTGFFPGSTIGNLDADDAVRFLARVRRHVGDGDGAIIGIDLRKPVERLLAAYDDSLGVTAQFNLNLLTRINRELQGDFAVDRFSHEARWNEEESAIEMHIRSREAQQVTVAGRELAFKSGETIHTESSRKYSVESFGELAESSGWSLAEAWMDDDELFAVVGLRGRK